MHDGLWRGLPGTGNSIHLLDEISLADNVAGKVLGLCEATEMLQVDVILARDIVLDDSDTALASG